MKYPHVFEELAQGTPEWLSARAGVVTASRFKDVMAKGAGKTRKTYMLELAGEIITGVPHEGFQSADFKRGHDLEPEARKLYEMISGNTAKEVGFIKSSDMVGYSPDSVIDDDGLLEIKTRKPALQLALLESDVFPSENIKQCQGGLWVSSRKWMDYISYSPGLPPWEYRVERDEQMISEISTAVFMFIVDLKNFVKKIEAM